MEIPANRAPQEVVHDHPLVVPLRETLRSIEGLSQRTRVTNFLVQEPVVQE